MSGRSRIERFSFAERVAHWMAALSFLYVAFTGLALWSPHLYWIASVMGGGESVRRWHPWVGVVFTVALGVMFLKWARVMRLDRDDKAWLRQVGDYIKSHEDMPEAGRFNGGQKMLFWSQCVLTMLLLASGVVVWLPELMPRGARELAIAIHPAAAIGSMAGIIVHIYMGTAAVPGALRSMIQGWVTPAWARAHHPKWYRDVSKAE